MKLLTNLGYWVRKTSLWAGVLMCVSCSSGMNAGWRTLQQEIAPLRANVRQKELNPNYRYLLIQQNEQESLLVWVGNEQSLVGVLSVWVSADGVVVRLCEGRLIGISELKRRWQIIERRSVVSQDDAQLNARWVQQISDLIPDYEMGHVQLLALRSLSPPKYSAWFLNHESLSWFEEYEVSSGLQTAVFAMTDEQKIVGGQRCMTPTWCVRWQSWPTSFAKTPA